MTIFKNLQRVAVAVAMDDLAGGNFGEMVKNAGIAAVMGGMNSAEWRAYMSLFADNAQQLTRLTTADPQTDPNYLPQTRAYIVTNSICGTLTGTRTHLNVKQEEIDDTLPDEPDGSVTKPFPIPNVNIPNV